MSDQTSTGVIGACYGCGQRAVYEQAAPGRQNNRKFRSHVISQNQKKKQWWGHQMTYPSCSSLFHHTQLFLQVSDTPALC